MRVALMVTCINDAMFPETGKAVVTAAAPARRRRRVPRGADLLRAADGEHRLPRRGGARRTHLHRRVRGVRRGRDAVRVVRRLGPAPARDRRAPLGRPRPAGGGRGDVAEGLRAVRVPRRRARREDVGAYFPHTVTYHPTCHSLRMLGVGDRPTRLLQAVRGLRPRRAAGRRGVLRLRRHVRGQERRHVGRDGLRQGPARARDRRRGAGRRGQLLPDAHRRACCPASGPAYA